MKALITGIAGFAGSHLAEYLLTHTDLEVHGTVVPGHSTANIAHLREHLTLHETDVREYDQVLSTLRQVRPDYVFHLAAQAAPALSLLKPAETITTNILGQLHVLAALVHLGLTPRVLVIGSADEYGLVRPEELPITEDNPLRPVNPYSVSKIAQDYLGYQYFLSHGLPIVRLRPFNHIGPRQAPGFVVADFAQQIAAAEAGKGPSILRVGNLDAKRDFTDVRDIVRAYYLAITKGEPGQVYNVGSGIAHTIRDILQRLLSMSFLSFTIEQDPIRFRPSDVPVLVCDYTKFRTCTGWQPEIPLERTLADTLDYWRRRITL